jgi:8-amino-7-oxononanoate synthase
MLRPNLKSQNSILRRCQRDEATRQRLKYDPWYKTIERQESSRIWVDGREMLMMSSNDYLGLSDHPRLLEAATAAMRRWGSSTTGARLANGSRAYHRSLEEKIATFLGREDCQVTSAGYLSCMSAINTFAQKGDCILVDRNVHSSLWSGILTSGASYERFAHNDPDDLADILSSEDPKKPKLLVFEGVYSMEGHIAPLRELIDATAGHEVFVILDDAHGFGVLGRDGRGSVDHHGLHDEVDIQCGSLSKSLSSTGGFVAGSKVLMDYLRTHSKQTIFSAAISPAQAACAETALDLMQSEPEHRERLWENTHYYKQLLAAIGANIWESQTPAVPIVIGSRERAYRIWKHLFESGIFTVLAITPAVPPGKDLIRTAVSARHSREDLERVAEILKQALKKF